MSQMDGLISDLKTAKVPDAPSVTCYLNADEKVYRMVLKNYFAKKADVGYMVPFAANAIWFAIHTASYLRASCVHISFSENFPPELATLFRGKTVMAISPTDIVVLLTPPLPNIPNPRKHSK